MRLVFQIWKSYWFCRLRGILPFKSCRWFFKCNPNRWLKIIVICVDWRGLVSWCGFVSSLGVTDRKTWLAGVSNGSSLWLIPQKSAGTFWSPCWAGEGFQAACRVPVSSVVFPPRSPLGSGQRDLTPVISPSGFILLPWMKIISQGNCSLRGSVPAAQWGWLPSAWCSLGFCVFFLKRFLLNPQQKVPEAVTSYSTRNPRV